MAAVGPMWAPWWAPAMNVLVWYVTSDYVTTFEGFSEPWSHLQALVSTLEVERHDLAGEYFAWGARRASVVPLPHEAFAAVADPSCG